MEDYKEGYGEHKEDPEHHEEDRSERDESIRGESQIESAASQHEPDSSIQTELSAQEQPELKQLELKVPESTELSGAGTLALSKPKKLQSTHTGRSRPARVQVDPSTVSEHDRPPQTGTVFNIWYLKWSGGDREDGQFGQRKSEGRCNIEKDSGYTKADKVPGSYFCMYFARGLCTKGKRCEYLHRLPVVTDIYPPNVDCFGRDKFSDYRDDMGGVGSFLKPNRTLYVGRIAVTDDAEEIVSKHFAEWGEIVRIRILNNRGVGFVTYLNESNAQFAKEAMQHQSLDGDEVLNIRWANEDPNPFAQNREKRRLEEQAAEAIRKLLPAEFIEEIEGKNPEAKKRRKQQSSFELEGYEAPDELWYARGENAINPLGRAEQKALEAANIIQSKPEEAKISSPSLPSNSLVSEHTLSLLKSRSHAQATAPVKNSLSSLAMYDSD